jgi:hypothetical protein
MAPNHNNAKLFVCFCLIFFATWQTSAMPHKMYHIKRGGVKSLFAQIESDGFLNSQFEVFTTLRFAYQFSAQRFTGFRL